MASRSYSDSTIKRLYSLAGNTCSYPNCNERLFSADHNISEVCHIEALNKGGPRYNSKSTDKERNAYSNLILLCKNHHGIVDEKDSNGSLLYDVAQLKAMKQAHEDSVEASRSVTFSTRSPSLIAKVVKILSTHLGHPKPTRVSHPFKIEDKIVFNKVNRYSGIIKKYSPYYAIVDSVYNEFEAGKKAALLDSINDLYLSCIAPSVSSDDIWDKMKGVLVEKINQESNLEYSEELEWCVSIIMVDAFNRCRVLEEPPK